MNTEPNDFMWHYANTTPFPASNLTLRNFATAGLMAGIDKVAEAVKLSYGAKGLNALIETDLYPYHQIANDAQTIIQAIHVTDDVEKLGVALLKELSAKADKDSGDGRKTTILIANEILKHGYRSSLQGMQLKTQLDNLIPIIEAKINKVKNDITENEVWKVATIASESEEMGKLLGEIYQKIGRNGIIIPEGSGTFQTTYNVIEGVRFQGTGYLSPYMVHDEIARKEGRKEMVAVYEKPTILVTKRKISHLNDINPLMESLSRQNKKDLVIFTDDMDSGVASVMVKAHKEGLFNILIIKAPVLWKNYVFEDFAKITGATIVEDASGVNFKNLELKHLGTCDKITVDKDETIIIGGKDISGHIADLESNGDNDSKLRLSWLQTKTAILKIGANNESELSYKRLKCHDAINSSVLALKDGVVKGGGVCLYNIAAEWEDKSVGAEILINALKAPLKQNLRNLGLNTANWGEDVVDAASVVKNAVRNAVALASSVLTVGMTINLPPKTHEELYQGALAAQKLRF